jgi:amino acid transporter
VFNGILFAILLFVGFEAAASIAEEMHAPTKTIPIAIIGTVALSGIFYLVVTYAATIGFGHAALDKGAWGGSPSPMGDLATQYVGKGLSVLIDLAVILDSLSLAIAIMVTGSRLLFALGRDGLLPRALASTSNHNTPLGGTIALGVWGVIILLWGGLTTYGANPSENVIITFGISATAGSFLVETIYVFLAVVAFKLVWDSRNGPGVWWRLVVVLIGLAAPILAFKGSLDPFPSYPNNWAVWFWWGGMAVALIWYLILRFTRPERVRAAAAYAADHMEIGEGSGKEPSAVVPL